MIALVIPGLPQPKERARFGRGRVYTPKNTDAWETALAWQARNAMAGKVAATGPVELVVVAVHKRPERRPAHVAPAVWGQGTRCYAVTTKDLDNVVKAVGDGLNHAGVWGDDNQVAKIEAWNLYAAEGESPCVEVRVRGAA